MEKIKSVLIFGLLLIILGCNSNEQPAKNFKSQNKFNINSREYKLLLSADKFQNRQAGFNNFWNIVKAAAQEQGAKVIEKEKNIFKEKHKKVSFLDTKKDDFRINGYMIRKKIKYKKGKPSPKIEYSCKFRSLNPVETAAADVSMSAEFTPKYEKIELEEDVVYNVKTAGGRQITCSKQNIVELDQEPGSTLADFAAIYPGLLKLGLDPKTEILTVNGIEVDEMLVRPGKIDFGEGLLARVDMTVWLINYKGRQISIPEISYDHEIDESSNVSEKTMQKCAAFLEQLQVKAPDWVVGGDLKAAILYKL